jgi:hypothetical protein
MKLKNINTLSEEVFIRPYSVQAVARKRNSLMNALQLNDNEFMNWVRDRLYRLAEQNKLPIKELTIDLIAAGFREWENTFRQSDKDFDQYMDEFNTYSQKFMKFSSRILKSNITDPDPNKLKPSEDAVPPVSPKMVKFQVSDNDKK